MYKTVIDNRNTYRNKVRKRNMKSKNESPKKIGTKWAQEENRIQREKIPKVWTRKCSKRVRMLCVV